MSTAPKSVIEADVETEEKAGTLLPIAAVVSLVVTIASLEPVCWADSSST